MKVDRGIEKRSQWESLGEVNRRVDKKSQREKARRSPRKSIREV
jgi:hypothetical protein